MALSSSRQPKHPPLLAKNETMPSVVVTKAKALLRRDKNKLSNNTDNKRRGERQSQVEKG